MTLLGREHQGKKEEMMINEFRENLFLSFQPCLRIKVSSQRNIDVSKP